ncbi:MAG: hypothetical protein M3R38_26565 [Actinomycetota bacterium]|nr:hypothetical protein [Actinomycetota bacterium]
MVAWAPDGAASGLGTRVTGPALCAFGVPPTPPRSTREEISRSIRRAISMLPAVSAASEGLASVDDIAPLGDSTTRDLVSVPGLPGRARTVRTVRTSSK